MMGTTADTPLPPAAATSAEQHAYLIAAGIMKEATSVLGDDFAIPAAAGDAPDFNEPANPAPVPALTGIAPDTADIADPAFTLVVSGTNFTLGSAIMINGDAYATKYVSDTTLSTTVLPSVFAAGPVDVKVRDRESESTAEVLTITDTP